MPQFIRIYCKLNVIGFTWPHRGLIAPSFLNKKIYTPKISERHHSQKLILALGDRESLSPQKFIPAKVYTNKVRDATI